MISNKVKQYCREDICLINNYYKAIADTTQTWDCHHINELTFTKQQLKKMNMYYNRPASELVFLTKSEHRKLHLTICAGAEEWKQHHSNSLKGKKHTEEWKLYISKLKINNTEFGRKFIEHYGIVSIQDHKLYKKEYMWYRRHNNKCRWV